MIGIYEPQATEETAIGFEDKPTFDRFIMTHWLRMNKVGLPDPTSEEGIAYYEVWRECLEAHHLSVEDTNRASARLAKRPPRPYEQLEHLLLFAGESKNRRAYDQKKPTQRILMERYRFAEQKARWDSLKESQRQAGREKIVRLNPGFEETAAKYPNIIEAECIEAIASSMEAERATARAQILQMIVDAPSISTRELEAKADICRDALLTRLRELILIDRVRLRSEREPGGQTPDDQLWNLGVRGAR